MRSTLPSRAGFPPTKNQKIYKEPFIQYYPSQAQELSSKKSKEHKVSGRFLSLLYQRLVFWSQYSKHIHQGKRFFWKCAEELAEEIFSSTKQIYRGLKALVELGLIERHKLRKHQYNHTYFYHLPHSVHTKELAAPTTTSSTRRTSSTGKAVGLTAGPSGAAGSFHKGRQDPPAASSSVSHIEPATGPAGPQEAVGLTAGPSGAAGGGFAAQRPTAGPSGAAGGGFAAQRPTAGPSGAAGRGSSARQSSSGNRGDAIRTTGADLPIKNQSISNIQISRIVERCELIAKYGIENINRKVGGLPFA